MKKIFKGASGKKKPVSLGLALQGGGSYGAFTKGVLKALLESDIITTKQAEIKAVSGTSAGAVNGALLVDGLNTGGPVQAIKNLDGLWADVGQQGSSIKSLTTVFNMMSGTQWPNISKQALAMGRASLPQGYVIDHLRATLERHVTDWDAVRSGSAKLFVNAVREDPDTKERSHVIFSGKALEPNTVTASGALEELGAIEIDGAKHFDGAYWANPSTAELEDEDISDLLVITIQEHPKETIKAVHQDKAREKMDRPGREVLTSEIHNHIEFLNKNNNDINLHAISFDVPAGWDETSRMNTDPDHIRDLEARGYQAGLEWIKAHGEKLGVESSYQKPRKGGQQKGRDQQPKP